jgi:uncharacterized BrkB/YihY/UPF0761 family membrane protein
MAERRQIVSHPLVRLLNDTLAAFDADGCPAFSAGLVYYSTLSTVPLLVMMIALPGLLLQSLDPVAGQRLVETITSHVNPVLAGIVVEFLERMRSQSLVVAAASVLGLLFSASSGFRFLRYAFRRIWQDDQRDLAAPGLARLHKTLIGSTFDYLIAFGLVFLAPLLGLTWLIFLLLASIARVMLADLPYVGGIVSSAIFPLSLLCLYAAIYIPLMALLSPVRLRWNEILIPGALCAGAVLVTTYGLMLYLRLFGAGSIYGAIGTLLAAQIWTHANAQALFFCAELSKQLVRRA